MSGVEVVGFLLGAFPLLISALEHYRSAAEVLEDWWQIKKEYKKCKNEIKVQELAFENNLERFLLPLIADDNEILALLLEPGGARWKDPALEAKLKSRLPKSYDLFLDTISDLQETMEGLNVELGVGHEAFQKGLKVEANEKQPQKSKGPLRRLLRQKQDFEYKVPRVAKSEKTWRTWHIHPNVEYQTQRIKFGFGGATRARLFEELGRYNSRLRELLDTNERSTALTQSRESLKKLSVQKAVWKLWRHAAHLHRLLEQAWCCQCKHMHRIRLLLHHELKAESIEYYICFLYTANLETRLPWTWVEAKAKPTDRNPDGEDFVLPVPQALALPSQAITRASTTVNPRSSQKDASLNPQPSRHRPTSPKSLSRPMVNWMDSSVPAVRVSTADGRRGTIISNICSSLANYDPDGTVLGVLQDDEGSYRLQRGGRTRKGPHDSISLETLLKGKSGVRLDRRQRYTIAFTLVSSHLQLYPSSWLRSHYTKGNIVFVKDPDDSNSFVLDKPYMLGEVVTAQPESSLQYASSDRLLPTLGILLVELCFGIALEDTEMRQQYQNADVQTDATADLAAALDLAVAMEWARLVAGEAGDVYADAVHWCLKPHMAGAKDDRWREELFTNVVLPLQYCHEQMYPKTWET